MINSGLKTDLHKTMQKWIKTRSHLNLIAIPFSRSKGLLYV